MIKFTRTTCELTTEQIMVLPFDWSLVHALDPEPHPALSLDEVIDWAKQYNEQNFDGSFSMDPAQVALILVRLCEVGMARVVVE